MLKMYPTKNKSILSHKPLSYAKQADQAEI